MIDREYKMFKWGYFNEEKDTQRLRVRCCPCGKAPTFWSINWTAALLHLLNTILTFAFWAAAEQSERDATYKLSETYAPWVNITGLNESTFVKGCPKSDASRIFRISDEFCVERRTAYTSDLSLWWLIITFHFLSFVFQAVAMAEWNVTGCKANCIRENYITEVEEHGTNVLRMIEYSLSATLMQISIALILGIWERLLIVSIQALTIVTMLCGLIAEQLKYDRKDMAWTAHITGWFSMSAVWLILGRQFWYTIDMANEMAKKKGTEPNLPPDFVYAIVIVIGVLYTGFGVIQFVQLCRSTDVPDAKLNRGVEIAYCVSSLTSKTFLGWIIFSSALSGMAES